MNKRQHREQGIATIELLIALAVGVVMLTGATLVSFGGQTAGLDTGLTRAGLSRSFDYFGQNVAAVANATNWNNPDLVEDDEYDSDTFYTHSVDSREVFPCVWVVEGNVAWTSEQDRGFNTGLQTLLGNVEETKKRSDCGSPFGGGDWDNPTTYGSAPPQEVDGQGTGIDVVRIGGKGYAFITTQHSDSKKHDLWSFDVSNPKDGQAPLDSINISSSSAAVVVAEDKSTGKFYAYVAGYSVDKSESCPSPPKHDPYEKQLQVVDVSNPVMLKPVASEDLFVDLVDRCGSYPAGHSIAFYDNKVYVGTKETSGDELTIFNVSSPESPIKVDSISVGRNVNAIAVRNNLAYLATGQGTISPYTPLNIYDVNTGLHVGSYSTTDFQQGTSLYLLGNTLFLGLEDGSGDEFRVLDISNPASIGAPLGSINLGLKNDTEITGISVRGRLAFLSTDDSNSEFFVLDISNLENIKLVSKCIPYNYSQATQGLVYFDNFVFVVDFIQAALRVIYDQPLACPKT